MIMNWIYVLQHLPDSNPDLRQYRKHPLKKCLYIHSKNFALPLIKIPGTPCSSLLHQEG